MTREEVIVAVKRAAEELGAVPTFDWLVKNDKVSKHLIRKHFHEFRKCLDACGLKRHRQGYELQDRELFADWGGVVRLLGKVPSMTDYQAHGRYSLQPLHRRFGSWNNVPAAMLGCARQEGMEEEWNDVLEIVAKHVYEATEGGRMSAQTKGTPFQPRIMRGEPIYGPPMMDSYLMMAPTNEQEVIFLFGAVGRKLGFATLKIQTEYPDGEAFREVGPGRWQRIKFEFELESKNFLLHRHDPAKCHAIVCWKHNWPECPLEVIELSSLIKRIEQDEIVCAKCRERETSPQVNTDDTD